MDQVITYALPITALIIAVATFIINNSGNKKLHDEIKALKDTIKSLKEDVGKLEKENTELKIILKTSEAARVELREINIELMRKVLQK